MSIEQLKFVKYPVLDQGFICLVDAMGNDASICQAARVSYGKDTQAVPHEQDICGRCNGTGYVLVDKDGNEWPEGTMGVHPAGGGSTGACPACDVTTRKLPKEDRNLIRYLMSHSHTTPFEMVEIKFMVQVPMDCWRQWIRHRTANVNEYSTRYTEAIDMCQTTDPTQWRLQASDNKQGSSGFLEEWPERWHTEPNYDGDPEVGVPDSCNVIQHITEDGNVKFTHHQAGPYDLKAGEYLSDLEEKYHEHSKRLYRTRLSMGVAKEQARKDLPLSTYTRAYWKCDLHNIFNFLRLRMDSHAQLEIRSYANAMYEIVKQIVPVACEAYEDYVLNACKFSAMEMAAIRYALDKNALTKRDDMSKREWSDFLKKVGAASS